MRLASGVHFAINGILSPTEPSDSGCKAMWANVLPAKPNLRVTITHGNMERASCADREQQGVVRWSRSSAKDLSTVPLTRTTTDSCCCTVLHAIKSPSVAGCKFGLFGQDKSHPTATAEDHQRADGLSFSSVAVHYSAG